MLGICFWWEAPEGAVEPEQMVGKWEVQARGGLFLRSGESV